MSLNLNLCSGCPLEGCYRPIDSRGPEDARFLIVTDTPSQIAAREDRLLTKAQIQLLGDKLEGAGFEREEFRFTPACHCAYDPNAHIGKVKTAAHKHCRQHLLNEIESHNLEAVIPLGALAASQTFGRTTKITKVRGLVNQSEELGLPVFPLMSPVQVVMYPQNEPVFNADIAALARSVNAQYDVAEAAAQQLGEYEIVTDLQFLIDMDPEVIAFDTEATGLRWYQSGTDVRNYKPTLHKGKTFFQPKFQILTMQFTVERGKGYMLVWDHPENPTPEEDKPRLRNQLRALLGKPERIVVGQNLKFDNVALWMTEGIRFRIGGDTLMLATLVDENLPEKNLDVLTKIFVPEMGGYADVFNATYNKSRMWEVPLDAMLGYGVGDTDAGYRLYTRLEALIMEDERQWAHYCHVTIPGLNAFAAMETRGMFIDEGTALAEFKQLMITDVARMERELLAAIPKDCKQGIVLDFLNKTNSKGQLVNKGKTPADALSFSRPDFMKQVLFVHPKGFRLKPKVFTKTTAKLTDERLREPSISAKDHLPYFFDECPFTMQLAEYQKDAHLLNTNVIKFEENYIRGGRVRPNYHLHKVVTGRSSCVKGDTPIITRRGTVHACDIVVGDEVWTHKERWMPVLHLYLKPVTLMYRLTFTDGQTLTATGAHRLLLNSGEWVEIDFILRGNYEYQQVGYAESNTVQAEQIGRENPTVRQFSTVRLRGCGRLPDATGRWQEVPGTTDCHVGASRYSSIEFSRNDGDSPHRREPAEQCLGKPSDDHSCRAHEDTRTVSATGRGLGIEKIEPVGVHRVYDFEVAQDHSYLACGVFSHNSDDPNGQNYPKRGARAMVYRRMFVAPEDGFLIEADLSQAELRIAACMSNDKTMIEIYRRGGDIHKATALIVAGKSKEQFKALPKKEQKELRQKAKAVNFGFLYGMGWRKFIGYAKTQYGVVFTEAEAQRIRKGFFSLYRSLAGWHEAMRSFAQEHKYVRSFSGRVRHLPMIDSPEEYIQQEAGRQAINSPVQEFGSSLGVMALGRINEEIDPQYLQFVGFIHDAIVVHVHKKYLDWGMRTLKTYMQTNPLEEWFNTRLKVPIIADVSFGLNLGEVHECEGFSLDTPFDYGSLVDKEGRLLIEVPRQLIPPNNGRLTRSTYALPEDAEDEHATVKPLRKRMVRAGASEAVEKRMERSAKQMKINLRNRAVREEESKGIRSCRIGNVVRRQRTL